jgi:hypothetical protein
MYLEFHHHLMNSFFVQNLYLQLFFALEVWRYIFWREKIGGKAVLKIW